MSTEPDKAEIARRAPEAPDDGGMDNILASIRRILNAEESASPPAEGHAEPEHKPLPPDEEAEDVFVLQPSMRVPAEPVETEPFPASPAPADPAPSAHADPVFPAHAGPAVTPPHAHDDHAAHHPDRSGTSTDPDDPMLAPETRQAAAQSLAALRSALNTTTSRPAPGGVYRGGGITVEDIVRDEVRHLLKSWLDDNLPPLVERLVKAEIARVVAQGG